MKTVFTLKQWGFVLAFLSSMLFYETSFAQKHQAQAKCAGFTAAITNGSVINLCQGSSITLAAAPVVTGYTYQWQSQTTAGGPFSDISGAAGTTYSTTNLGAYRVIVNTGSCIDTSGITSVTRITVQGGTITASKTRTLCYGESGGLITGTSVPGADVGLVTYSWEKNENNAGWVTVPGVTDANITATYITSVTKYRRVAKDNCGNSQLSNEVTFNVVTVINPGTLSPATQTINRNQVPAPITGTVASGGTGSYLYKWQASPWANGPWVTIPGAKGTGLVLDSLKETYYYRRIAVDSICLVENATTPAEVKVNKQILNAGTLVNTSTCAFKGQVPGRVQIGNPPRGGDTTKPYTYQWQKSIDLKIFTDIPGANALIYQPPALDTTTYFRLKVTDASGTFDYSDTVGITVVSTPLTGGSIKSTAPYACLGSSPAEIISTGSPTGYAGLGYQWQYKNNSTSGAWTDIPNAQRESVVPPQISEMTTYRRKAIDACGSSSRVAYSNEVVVDIKPAINAGDISPTSQMIRAGQTPKQITNVTSPTGGTGAFKYSWESAPLAVGPFATVSSATGLDYQPGTLTQSTYYRRAVTDTGCRATKYTYIVEVYFNNAPPVTGGNLAGSSCVFPGNTPSIITTGSIPPANGSAPYTYTWETRAGTTGTWTVIPNAVGETYQPPIITQTTQYRRQVTDRWGETAYSDIFTINYVTTPLNPGTIVASNPSSCGGATPATINEVTPAAGGGQFMGYQWQMRTGTGAWTDIAGETKASLQPAPISQKTYYRRAAMDKCSEVTRTTYSNEVFIDLTVVTRFLTGLVDGPFITCSGTAPGTIRSVLDACAGNATVKYQWEYLQGTTWTAITGATSASYTPGAITTRMIYRRKVYTDCGNVGYSNNVEMFVYPSIEPGVIGAATQTVCASNGTPEMIKLMTNCHYTDGTVSYQWQNATSSTGTWSNIAGATTNQYQPTGTTVNMYYRLMVKSTTCNMTATTNVASVMVNAQCRPAATGSRAAVAGTVDASANDMKVYPNPVTGNSLDVKLQTKGTVKVTLMNAEGRAVPVNVSNTGSGLMRISSSSTALPSGMYLLTVKDENGGHSSKIMVQ